MNYIYYLTNKDSLTTSATRSNVVVVVVIQKVELVV
jgi:hypothetical protein